jgi:HIP---CoA ligase
MEQDPRTLPAVLRAAADVHRDSEAVVDGPVRLTYGELLERVRRTAAALVALGVEPGSRVCVWAPNSWQWQVAALAVTYCGGVLVPLNTRYTGHEAVDVVGRTSARVVVVADGFLGRRQHDDLLAAAGQAGLTLPTVVVLSYDDYPVAGEDVLSWDDLERLAADVDPAAVEQRAGDVRPDDVADILFTSGTTGRSKGAVSAHRQVVAAASGWAACGGVTAADRYLVVNPYFHSFGYKAGIVVALLSGATVVPQAVFDVDETFALVERERISILPGAPTIYQVMLESARRAEHDLSSLRLAVTGAATVPVTLVRRMQSEMGFDTVLTAYGLTEAVVATMCRPGDDDERVATTCGRAVDGMELRIAAPGGNAPLAAGTEGEVLLRGPNVTLGYLDDPAATAEAIDTDGWLHTGDVGRVDEDGYLRITDRIKDLFIVGGFNVYPAEVEQVLAALDGVVESAVVGVPDARLGEVGHAHVVRRAGSDLDEAAVLAHARERLANFKVPRGVTFVDDLPRNASGKILKRELRST